jgi:hypothetical protein
VVADEWCTALTHKGLGDPLGITEAQMMKRARHSKNIRTDQGNLPQASPYSADQRASETKHEYEIARRVAYWTKITGIGTIAAAIFAAIGAGLAGVTARIFWKQLGTMQAQLTAQKPTFGLTNGPSWR